MFGVHVQTDKPVFVSSVDECRMVAEALRGIFSEYGLPLKVTITMED